MRIFFKLLVVFFATPGLAGEADFAINDLDCQQNMSGAPFVKVHLKLNQIGTPVLAQIDHYGSVYHSNFRVDAPSSGEWLRLSLDIDRPGSELGFVVFLPNNGVITSDLINNQSPIGKHVPGVCVASKFNH